MQNRRRFRSRPSRPSNVRFTFHSYGTHFSFDPYQIVEDDRLVNEANWFDRVKMLDLYKAEVRAANGASHVFILDDQGNKIKV